MPESADSLLASVKKSPHWRVVIRPESFEKERIKTLRDCWELMESCRVRLRGWDYPHVAGAAARENGNDWIASWSNFIVQREYWRLYQSGQFVHLFSFAEDHHEDAQAKIDRIGVPQGRKANGCLDFISALYKITEIFEFATRLAQKGILGESVYIGIQMIGVKDRVLLAWDTMRMWDGYCPASEDILKKELSIELESLIGESADHAIAITEWFFERFNCMDISHELLIDEQRKFLERKSA